MQIERFLVEGCSERVAFVEADSYIQVVDLAGELTKCPTKRSKRVNPSLEFGPEACWADPNSNTIVDVSFIQHKAES